MDLTTAQQFELAKQKMMLESASKEQVIELYLELFELYFKEKNLVKSQIFKDLGLNLEETK